MHAIGPSAADQVTREEAFPQLGLPPTATSQQIKAAYDAAVAELERLTREARSQTLCTSYKRARAQLDQAYELLRRQAPPAPAKTVSQLDAPARPAPPRPAVRPQADRDTDNARAAATHAAAAAQRAILAAEQSRAAASEAIRQAEEARRLADAARREAQGWQEAIKGSRSDVGRVNEEAQALRELVSQLRQEAMRELAALQDARKRADHLLRSAERNESETATAALHAEAYRDSAMYAAQAAEKLLRALAEPEQTG